MGDDDVGNDEHPPVDHDDVITSRMSRGKYLKQLRLVANLDEEERRRKEEEKINKATTSNNNHYYHDHDEEVSSPPPPAVAVDADFVNDELEEEGKDQIDNIIMVVLPNTNNNKKQKTVTVLRYGSYLNHQRYYDDLKHVDITFIDYGIINTKMILDGDVDVDGDVLLRHDDNNNRSRNDNDDYGTCSSSATAEEVNNSSSSSNDGRSCCGDGGGSSGRLIIRQKKELGKGGLVSIMIPSY